MTHEDFISAYARGELLVRIDRERAARLVSSRMALPFLLLPILGAAVALALMGKLFLGIAIFLLALVFRYVVRASSQGFVLSRALQSAAFYQEMRAAGVLELEPAR